MLGWAKFSNKNLLLEKAKQITAIFITRWRVKLYNVYKVKLTTHKPEVLVFASSGEWVGGCVVKCTVKPPRWFVPLE